MRPLCCCLFATILVAQDPGAAQALPLKVRTGLGSGPTTAIELAPPGCWDGLLLSASLRPAPPPRRRGAEATVEVWDLLPPSETRREAFSLYLGGLRERLSRAFTQPPPKLQALELGDIMQSDPSQPQKLDLTKVKSMQERFNRLPPSGLPAK
ncbi:MAG: hypothetical protein HXX12_12300 [Geothrix sp.]|uniref:hypothetical protein n=1 Tax=Geothrix sp. TaxID=1962974 RepID=UPI0017CDE914|nr:hypothetical protein [Geothrix sp.]NWJ41738.1 hypothetical protein [Geothrix sp.]WIL20283.1 MAG: hypothetical protein QOZ81_002842 [Geothrix sp.]